jgi:hypothetical protein
MHINKMALAAVAKKAHPSVRNIGRDTKTCRTQKLYKLFRKTFDKAKKAFKNLQAGL